ncbi:hypothetical protein [Stenotrophomonas maltophilia]
MPDSLQVDFPALLDGDEVLKEERFAGIAGGRLEQVARSLAVDA